MRNVKITVKDNVATITVDLSKDLGSSKSGKTVLIATTGGNQIVKDDIRIGVNCYKPKTED